MDEQLFTLGLSATSFEGETKGEIPDGNDSNPQGGVVQVNDDEEDNEFTHELETHNRWLKSKKEKIFFVFFFSFFREAESLLSSEIDISFYSFLWIF